MRTLKVAAELIPFPTVEALRVWLNRRPADFPPRYRPMGRWRWVRLLTESECERIRTMTVKTGRWNDIRRRTATQTAPQTRA